MKETRSSEKFSPTKFTWKLFVLVAETEIKFIIELGNNSVAKSLVEINQFNSSHGSLRKVLFVAQL